MSDADDTRDEEMLARLAEFDLSAAERVHGRLMAAEAAGEIAELGRTYQRIARSLRQTLALKAKLKRDRAQAAAEPATGKPGGMAVARRIRELRQAVARVIWNETETEGSDFETRGFYEECLDELIVREALTDDFCREPLDDHVARVCLLYGFSPQATEGRRDLPDPPPRAPGDDDADDEDPEGDAPAWRGSG